MRVGISTWHLDGVDDQSLMINQHVDICARMDGASEWRMDEGKDGDVMYIVYLCQSNPFVSPRVSLPSMRVKL